MLAHTGGSKSYILAPNNLKVGDKITSGFEADIKLVIACRLKHSVGTIIHNVEMKPGKEGSSLDLLVRLLV